MLDKNAEIKKESFILFLFHILKSKIIF